MSTVNKERKLMALGMDEYFGTTGHEGRFASSTINRHVCVEIWLISHINLQ
jgi:hypothetical protein